jgi:type I site-specific restriction endonuclease
MQQFFLLPGSLLFPFLTELVSAILRAPMASPEELARHNIDAVVAQCGWKVQKRSEINLSAGRGIAVTEGLLKGGDEADYLLFVDGKQSSFR